MYKTKSVFIKDFFQEDSREFRKTNVFSMDTGLLDLPMSEIQTKEEIFLDNFLMSKNQYESGMNFIHSHFVRESQDNDFYQIKLTGYKYFFKDIGGEIWNKESHKLWQEFSRLMNDNTLMILEDDYTMGNYPLGFNFHFPLSMSWEDFSEGGYISATLLYENFYSYFMFGDSENWIRYIETDGHRELGENGELSYECDDYLILAYTTPEIEGALKNLGFKNAY